MIHVCRVLNKWNLLNFTIANPGGNCVAYICARRKQNEQERANEADKNMQRLEQREAMADKAEEVTKMAVTVFDCAQVFFFFVCVC